ncbi:MAG: EutN/CcmL family microcompartment protein [Candidatus Omnitrophica bacterium]|nr:EutN/CcmL family microcompartment protein [Candidatus Omnitrophota bacterium]
MNLAKVIGSLWATQKHHSFNGMKFCFIQPLNEHRQPAGKPLIAVDPDNRCGQDETVYYVEGGDAATIKPDHTMPSDATIVGIVDSLSTDHKS